MSDRTGSEVASDVRTDDGMRTVVIEWMEHAVYEAVVEIPAELRDADYSDIHEWLDEQGYGMPDGKCLEVTLQEITDVKDEV